MLNGRKEQNSFLLFYINGMEEVFIRIEDYDDYYVSNLGNFLSFKNGKERILKPGLFDRYLVVTLTKNKVAKTFHVHKLVAKAFIPNPNNYDHVHHINGNRLDNRVENLMWVDGSKHISSHRKNKHKLGCYDLNGNLIKIYQCKDEIMNDGHIQEKVLKCCRNKKGYHTHHGFRWKFID